MPFVSSVRGGYGLSKRPFPEYILNANNSGISGGSITTAGGYRIHTFDYTGGDQTFTVTSPIGTINGADVILKNVEIYAYAGGGGSGAPGGWGRWSSGGGGGFAGGTVSRVFSDTFKVVVGQGGGSGQSGNTAYGGGGRGYSWGNGGGGGLSGIFSANTFAQANAVLIAGGGGGGGASRNTPNGCAPSGSTNSYNQGGGGGGTNGQDGVAYNGAPSAGKGGTQSAGGAGATQNGPTEAGSALQGANRDSSHGAGGGGGYFGGGSGTYFEPDSMGGGGGGSGYYKASGTNAVTSPILTSGDYCTTANTGGIYWANNAGVSAQSSNTAGSPGRLVIRYLTS